MPKPFTVDEDQIKHYVLPEVTGDIVGFSAENLRPQTVEDIETLQREAYEEGLAQGLEEGRREGLAEVREQARKLAAMFDFFSRPLQTLDEEVEHQLTQLALEVARCVIKKECETGVDIIRAVIHEALEFLPVSARNVRIRVNPEDYQVLQQGGIAEQRGEWTLLDDAKVSRGGCMVESDTSHVDASLETRVVQIVERLTEHSHRYDDES